MRRRRLKIAAAAAPPIVGVPSYACREPLELREIPAPAALQRSMLNVHNSYLRCYLLGECSVIVTRELGDWHISISHRLRYPTWDEVAEARYRVVPDHVTMAMLLPPRAEYINMNKNCFQLVEIGRESG